jgi:hypothetical protein
LSESGSVTSHFAATLASTTSCSSLPIFSQKIDAIRFLPSRAPLERTRSLDPLRR